MREKLVTQFETMHGVLTYAAEQLIERYLFCEKLRLEAVKELEENGIRERYLVGRYQTGTRENKSLAILLKLEKQQLLILKDLGLLPNGRKRVKDEEQDDDEDDIDNY